MSEEIRQLSRQRVIADIVTGVFGASAICTYVVLGESTALVIGVYGLLLGTSTAVVTFSLTQFTGINVGGGESEEANRKGEKNESRTVAKRAWQIFTGKALENDSDVEEDTGWLIGRLENVIVLTLVLVGAYTALSIIFAAKSWVRREDTASENTTYYLAGTLVNFTYSIVVGIGVVWILDSL